MNNKKQRLNALPNNGWVNVKDSLPDILETVWISNGKGWTTLGCRTEYGWAAVAAGIIYEDDGKIVAECEADDFDVRVWYKLPKAYRKPD